MGAMFARVSNHIHQGTRALAKRAGLPIATTVEVILAAALGEEHPMKPVVDKAIRDHKKGKTRHE